jgi:flagellar biosynthesis protein FlhF
MRVVPFIAKSPAEALARIQAQLGPDAIVLSVRPVPAKGLTRLWSRSRAVEVLAAVADEFEASSRPEETAALLSQNRPLSEDFSRSQSPRAQIVPPLVATPSPPPVAIPSNLFATDSVSQNRSTPASGALPPLADDSGRPHVFIGPPGVGKTTVLCKLFAQKALSAQETVQVWRLNGESANTAEILDIYGEMFGVTVERFWKPAPASAELLLVDLPGTEAADLQSLNSLKEQLKALGNPRVHLVLNAAYDAPVLFEQFRAFAPFRPEDLSFTHLDEEPRREKLWNLAQGTDSALRFLSGGQKIPGEFVSADAAPFAACAIPL